MQPNKTKIALQVGALLMGSSFAFSVAATSFDLIVNTIGDVTIDTVTALEFGENITTDALGVCSMDADAPAAATVFADAALVAANYGDLTGGNCIGSIGAGTPGVYSISGEAGLEVSITLTEEVTQDGGYTFSPTGGCAVVHDGTALLDACTALVVGTPLTAVRLADAVDAAPAILNETHFTVGGTITVGAAPLDSDKDYIPTFNVNVTY